MNLALRGISHNLGNEADSSFTHDLHKSKFCIQQRRNIGTNIVMKYMKKSQRNGVKDIRLILLNKRKGLL